MKNSGSNVPAPPRHIAIIMDGNGRWATARGLERSEGHRAGARQLETVLRAARQAGVKELTLYAFSTENWNRPKLEVRTLMAIFRHYATTALKQLCDGHVRLNILGRLDRLPATTAFALRRAMAATAAYRDFTLNIAINYGGRAEICDAASAIVARRVAAKDASPVVEEEFAAALYCPQMSPPDLLIRTGGEQRLSNFLLWELSYAEFYFTPVYWPDFGEQELLAAIAEFQNRHRRFGKIK